MVKSSSSATNKLLVPIGIDCTLLQKHFNTFLCLRISDSYGEPPVNKHRCGKPTMNADRAIARMTLFDIFCKHEATITSSITFDI